MKKELFFTLSFFLISYNIQAQITKVLHNEEDGYKWYETKDGNGFYGAENIKGKTLIPLSKKYIGVSYQSPFLKAYYDSNVPDVIYKYEYYTKEGKEILDNSKYDDTFLHGGKNGVPYWFSVEKNGKEGACDINGNEIIPPLYSGCIYSSIDGFNIEDEHGNFQVWDEYKDSDANKAYIQSINNSNNDVSQHIKASQTKVTKELKNEEDGFKWYNTNDGNGHYGAEDLKGKTLIPLSKKYIGVSYQSPFLSAYYHSNVPGVIYKNDYYTKEGKEILDNSKYDDTFLHGGKNDEPYWFSVEKNGKKGACDINGKEIIPPLYSGCIYSIDGFNIKDEHGEWQVWDEYRKDNIGKQNNNNTATMQTKNVKELFDKAYNTPNTDLQTKINLYNEVIKADVGNRQGFQVLAINNLGVIWDEQGDLASARQAFERVLKIDPKNELGKKNLKSVKSRQKGERADNISNSLNKISQGLIALAGVLSGNNNANQNNAAYNEIVNDYAYDSSSGNSYNGNEWQERNKKREQQQAESRMFRNSEHLYSEYANRITALSNDSYPYNGWSKEKKRQEARDIQSKMRKIRTEYKEKTGKDLPAAQALQKWENWTP